MIDIRYCLYPFARAFEIVGSHTHTYTNTLIPFHIFFHYGIISLFMTRGWYPQSYQHCWGLCSLSIFVCLKQKNRLYYRVFLPVSFFRERCSFLCVKMFFFYWKNLLRIANIQRHSSHFLEEKKGRKNCSFVGYQNFPFFSHAYLLRILPSAALICWYFTSLSQSLPSISGQRKTAVFPRFCLFPLARRGVFFPLSSRKEVFLD